jgi:hypothetical protein
MPKKIFGKFCYIFWIDDIMIGKLFLCEDLNPDEKNEIWVYSKENRMKALNYSDISSLIILGSQVEIKLLQTYNMTPCLITLKNGILLDYFVESIHL